ncbi:MAG: PIG-L family deacetylase [Verrucomicrobiales bacterium]|nr:PIG-L family deacetylase [Verrucomicrobiales bacterium]
MKLLFVHAHFDDYEFTAAGTFELWRRRDGPSVQRRVVVCTDGAAGHHRMTRAETAARRKGEQEKAARLGGFEFRLLQDSDGSGFREGRLHASPGFLPALWREIRAFEPDYLFCPPLPSDVLAGVHVDHLDVAQAVRSVGYMINVPRAFEPEYPGPSGEPEPVRTPVIVNTYDGYMAGGHGHDLAVDVTSVVDFAADLAWCHESQLKEWLPWVDRHNLRAPAGPEDWRPQYREVLARRKAALGIADAGAFEVFSVTAWGVVPTLARLLRDFPGLSPTASRLDRLGQRLEAWGAAGGE